MYTHTQAASYLLRGVVLAACLAAALAVRSLGSNFVVWAPIGIGVLTVIVFGSLTTEVSQDRFTFWFGPGVVRRSFLLSEIRTWTPVTNLWWYGWGIHFTPHGWLYNVGGRDAVQFELTSGRRFRVGTDAPAALCEMIRVRKGAA